MRESLLKRNGNNIQLDWYLFVKYGFCFRVAGLRGGLCSPFMLTGEFLRNRFSTERNDGECTRFGPVHCICSQKR